MTEPRIYDVLAAWCMHCQSWISNHFWRQTRQTANCIPVLHSTYVTQPFWWSHKSLR